MRRNLISAFLVLVAALLVVGLTLSRSTRGRADFAFVNGTEPKTLDPNVITGEPEGRIAQEVFEGLTRLEARSLEPVPGAAESWEITPDGKTYTFHMRPSARWSDGHPVTAHDFAYSWKRMQEPALGTEYAYIMHMMRFAEAYNTHAAQADALQGPILKALDELAARYPGVVPKEAVRAFDTKQSLHGVLKGTPNPKLSAFLSSASRDLSSAELLDLRRELQTEGARRRALHDEAVRHFGIDGGVYAKDNHTLVVELVAPTPYFLELTAFHPFYPVPRWAVERSPHAWFLPGSIVGNGPFLLADWRVGDRIRLERSPTYWGRDAVKLKSAEALAIENVTTALNLYLTGEVDWLPHNNYPLDLSLDLKKRADFYVGPALIVYFYRINSTKKPFNDVRVRRAINLAIDREQITRDVLLLGQLPATHFVPPGIRGYVPPATGISYDVAQARKLLAEAGFPDGEGFPKFGILYNTLEQHKKLAEVVADQLHRNLNIEVAAYNQEWQSYLESERALNYDVSRGGWVGDYEDPNTFLDIWVTNGGNNRTGWGNLVYDRLIEAAANVEKFLADPTFLLARAHDSVALKQLAEQVQTSKDAATRLDAIAKLRLALLAEAEGILVNGEYPVIPLYFYVISGLVKPNVGGFYADLVGTDGQKRSNLRDLHPLRGIEMKAAELRAGWERPMIEVLTLVLGLALLAATAWCPPRLTRVLGSALFGFVVGVVLRFSIGATGGVVGGLVAAGVAFRFLPLLVLRRVVFLVPALVLLIFATTVLMYKAPGNPFANERASSPQVEAALRAQYGVPKNANQFFGIYMRRLLVEGTLGPSIKVQGRTVEQLIAPAFPVSLSLGLLALTLSVIFGLSLGILAGLRRNSAADYLSMGLALIGVSLPSFVIGATMMIVFSLWLGWLPVAGWGSFRHLVMPALALSLPSSAVIARLSRSGIIEVMQQDFVRTARAKGLPESWVIGRHALRGAIIPVVSYLGPAAAAIMTGSFVVEVLFAIPGMGQWFVKGAINRDYSVVLGTAIVYFGMVILFNLLVDLAYAWLDPRVREERA